MILPFIVVLSDQRQACVRKDSLVGFRAERPGCTASRQISPRTRLRRCREQEPAVAMLGEASTP